VTGLKHQRQAAPDRGAAAVEFALILPLFMLLVFGTISSGFAFERWINVTQAARETSRFAATLPMPSSPATISDWFDDVHAVAVETAGIDASDTSSYFICIRFVNDAGPALIPASQTRTWGTLSTPAATCTSSSSGDNRVEVLVQRAARFGLVIAPPNLTIAVGGGNTSRYEPRLG
jgi:Flp pilus assembly protein TadG